MKKSLFIVSFLSLSLLCNAQSNIASTVLSAVKTSGLLQSTNYAFEPYLTYAPQNNANQHVGGGILALYNFNNYVAAGLGVDYLGQFSLVSGNATIKLPINVGKYLPFNSSLMSNLVVTPFALGGIGTPLSGSPNSVSTIEDVGAYVQLGHLWGGKFNIGACYGQWDNSGDYSGKRYHLFAGWSKGF